MAGERDDSELNIPDVLAILPLRGTVIFPQAVMPLAVGRPASVRLIQEALQGSRIIGAVMQRDPSEDAPRAQGLHTIGTATIIEKALKQPDGTLRLVVQGLARFRITDVVQETPFLRARIQRLPDEAPSATLEVEALTRTASGIFQKVVALSPTLPDELANVLGAAEGPGALADLIAGSLPTLPTALREELLETMGVAERLQRLVAALTKEAEVLELGSKIQSEVQSEMSKTQREYYLREQMKAIQKELGDADDRTQEIDTLRRKIETAGMTEEAGKDALRELDRLAKMPPAAAEYTVARTYIDWLVSMPWEQETADDVDIAGARAILDEDHEGVEKIKERILEYLAVKKIRASGKDPILCFVGPPGVGKTSLGRSIARALGRKFHRISLGGMRDEAEIRGHRRTYIGALPGQIIQGLRRAGTKHLLRTQAREHGLGPAVDIEFTPEALRLLARGYTREAGVRNLEREIASVCRKVARRRAEGHTEAMRITPDVVTSFLGVPRFELEEVEERTRVPGVAIGLAWTPAGGDILFVEATRMKGARTLTLTGQLGDVMKESVQAALSWVRSHVDELGIAPDFWEMSDIHVHVPAGAIPKDGPSAGVTMTTALVSLLTSRRVRSGLAMTGEVSLAGRVLPVGGIKEKVLAAHRAGIRTVLLPKRNAKNLIEDVPLRVRAEMTIHLVDSVPDVLRLALEDAPAWPEVEPLALSS